MSALPPASFIFSEVILGVSEEADIFLQGAEALLHHEAAHRQVFGPILCPSI